MGKIIITDGYKIRDYDDIEFAEKIIKKRKNSDPWSVIDELVKYWARRTPENVKAVMINVDQYKEQIKDKEFGQTFGGTDMERRFTLSFPYDLMMLIRTQYKSSELPFDRKFYREFAKRYPAFKVAEKN